MERAVSIASLAALHPRAARSRPAAKPPANRMVRRGPAAVRRGPGCGRGLYGDGVVHRHDPDENPTSPRARSAARSRAPRERAELEGSRRALTCDPRTVRRYLSGDRRSQPSDGRAVGGRVRARGRDAHGLPRRAAAGVGDRTTGLAPAGRSRRSAARRHADAAVAVGCSRRRRRVRARARRLRRRRDHARWRREPLGHRAPLQARLTRAHGLVSRHADERPRRRGPSRPDPVGRQAERPSPSRGWDPAVGRSSCRRRGPTTRRSS